MIDTILAFVYDNRWAVSYGLAVLLLVLTGYSQDDNRKKCVSSSLFLLWAANIFYTETTSNMTPVLWLALMDFIVGSFIILTSRGCKWQRDIGSWFIPMMVAHIAYWFYEPQTFAVQYAYWVTFTLLGWAQLCHVGIWYIKTSNRFRAIFSTWASRFIFGRAIQ